MSGTDTLTLQQIAKAIGISRQAVAKRLAMEGTPFIIGKRKAKLFSLDNLPKDIRAVILDHQAAEMLPSIYNKVYDGQENSPALPPESALPAETSGPETALTIWTNKPESCREEARTRLNLVNKARNIKARNKGGVTVALRRYAKSQQVSLPTLYKYIKDADSALKDAQQNGQDAIMAQLMALTPGYGGNKGVVRSFCDDAIHYALGLYATQQHLNISDVHKHTVNEGQIQGWKVGSYDSLQRILDRKMNNNLKVLARKGKEKYQANCELKILRDYREIWPNFMWCGDHHIFDVFVKAPGGQVRRPWLTAWMDMSSRSFMGWCINFAPNSRTIALALAHGISRKDDVNFPQHGVPWSVYIDNGKDYRSKYLNGEKIKIGQIDYPEIMEKYQALGIDPFYIDLEYDPGEKAWVKKRGRRNIQVRSVKVGGVYSRLNITQRYAIAYHPWSKPIERAFRNVVQQFSRELPGWCGSGHEQRPEKLAWELKKGMILDYKDFCDRFYNYIVYEYNNAPHTGHGMDGRSPNEVFRAYGAPEAVDPELLAFSLYRKERVKIHNWGFQLNKSEFELDIPVNLSGAAILNKVINRYATVLYHPEYRIIRVYVDGKYICDGKPLQRASFIRPDDPVMQDKLKLQAYQKRLNQASLARIHEEAPAAIMGPDQALLELSRGESEATPEDLQADMESMLPKSAKGFVPAEHEHNDPIPMTEEERYRQILRKEARGVDMSDSDKLFKEEYEQTDEYSDMQQLYEAELSYMQHQYSNQG